MTMAYWLLGCFIFHAFGQSTNGLNKGNVTCGSSVEAVYDDNSLWHTYDLKINFYLCSSELDLWIGIYNEYNSQASIADEHCPGGDGCDKCSISNNNYPENFTIPFMLSGIYTIHISPYYVGDHGAYGLKIKCNPSSILPNTTTIYTTPIPSEPPTNITPSPTFNILSIIKCGDLLSGELLNNDDINYYYFNLTNDTHYLQFDSCLSSYRTALYLYDMNFSLLYQGEDNIDCGLSERLFITEQLQSGQYILKISGWGVDGWHKFGIWRLSVHCKPVTPILNPTYILRTDITSVTWFQANIFCDIIYKTSLATVITFENFKEAKQLLSLDYPSMTLIGTWIGLYNEGIINSNTSKWQWADGTLCHDKYTTSCNGIMTDNFSGYPMAAYISYSSMDKQSLQIYSHTTIGHGLSWIDDYQFGFMCNHPNGSYGMNANRAFPQCYNIDGCWNNLHCCGMIDPIVNDTWDLHRPPIAYWNNKLFVVGIRNLHYTYLKITNNSNNTNNFNWSNVIYNQIQQSGAEFYQTHYADYIHFQSSLYLLAIDELTDYDITTLLHIDLDSITTTANAVPRIIEGELLTYQTVDSCMVSNNNHIWIITRTYVAIYNIITGAWTRSKQPLKHNDTSPHACGITNDYKFIYIFGWQDVEHVFKYNIEIDKFVYLDTPNICWMLTAMHAITAPNGKIYIHGCYISSWKTAIFDPIKEQFEVNTVDIDSPIDNIRHKEAQLTIFDDNILLLYSLYGNTPDRFGFDNQMFSSLYFGITNKISFNFSRTVNMAWPSDGFEIRYSFNDFHQSTQIHTYIIQFYCNQTETIIKHTILINKQLNDCICNINSYNCYECHQYFNLGEYLQVTDNHLDILHFTLLSSPTNNEDILILPNFITIALQRCHITFTNINPISDSDNPLLRFTYLINSPNCFSRTGSNFSLRIISSTATINKLMTLYINDNNLTEGTLCDVTYQHSSKCINFFNGFFEFEHKQLNPDVTQFEINFISNMIDLKITNQKSFTVKYFSSKLQIDIRLNHNLFYLLFILLIPILIILLICIYCRLQWQNAFVVNKALVLIIGICQFDDKEKFLAGVKKNVIDLMHLWNNLYQYHVFVCNSDTLYCTKQDIVKFMDKYKTKLEDKSYNAVIVHLISHGSDGFIDTSDEKQIKTEFFTHELTNTAMDAKHLSLIKLIFHHGCQGPNDYYSPKSSLSSGKVQQRAGLNIHVPVSKVMSDEISYYSNCLLIKGNVSGRAMSDSGKFTKSICEAFETNLKRKLIFKADLNGLLTEIGRNLEKKTESAELCNHSGTLRYNPIRFEKFNDILENEQIAIDLQQLRKVNSHREYLSCNIDGVDKWKQIELMNTQTTIQQMDHMRFNGGESNDKSSDSEIP